VRQTLDDAGALLSASGYAYTPFGVPQSGATPQPFGFTGELHHGELQYLRALGDAIGNARRLCDCYQ
jgi:hypothetical protein